MSKCQMNRRAERSRDRTGREEMRLVRPAKARTWGALGPRQRIGFCPNGTGEPRTSFEQRSGQI